MSEARCPTCGHITEKKATALSLRSALVTIETMTDRRYSQTNKPHISTIWTIAHAALKEAGRG